MGRGENSTKAFAASNIRRQTNQPNFTISFAPQKSKQSKTDSPRNASGEIMIELFEEINEGIKSGRISPPIIKDIRSGQHNLGTVWEEVIGELIHKEINKYGKIMSQADYINGKLTEATSAQTIEEKLAAIGSLSLQKLLKPNETQLSEWSEDNPIQGSQTDTADHIIVFDKDPSSPQIIDIKSHNQGQKDCRGNLISASKIDEMCIAYLEDPAEYELPNIWYINVNWEEKDGDAVCTSIDIRNLLWTDPDKLKINQAAAAQVQADIHQMPQDFKGTPHQWAKGFLKNSERSDQARCRHLSDIIKRKREARLSSAHQ